MSEQPKVDPTLELKQAGQEIDEAKDLAYRTGIVHQTEAEAERHGVRAARTGYAYYDDESPDQPALYDLKYRPSIETESAAIAITTNHGAFPQAKTKEQTGNYSTADFAGGDVAGGVVVTRPDGSGGTYRGHIGGATEGNRENPVRSRAERATAIVAKRAAKRVGEAVAERAISIGEELKEKRDGKK